MRGRSWALGDGGRILVGLAALVCVVLPVSGRLAAGLQEEPFPHEAHQGLFPLCTGCHQGVPGGDAASYYPDPGSCAGCHDGLARGQVAWSGPSREASNVRFEHLAHERWLVEAGEPDQECRACHVPPGGERMEVATEVQLGACWGCHANQENDHQVGGDCETCHVPLASSGFGVRRIEGLSVPLDHLDGTFLSTGHGAASERELGRCATCHTRDRCVACHVDQEVAPIPSMPSAPIGMHLPAWSAAYHVPSSHETRDWTDVHGRSASRDTCGTCHTSDDCAACHLQPVPLAVSSLPSRAETSAPGVRLAETEPSNHRSAFFLESHGTLSASRPASCVTCHEETFCSDCHEAPLGSGYHPPDFLSRHAPSAFGQASECANCHSTQLFCRECHAQTGITSSGRLGAGYHDGSPLWLLRHGQPARQSLESCAGCHAQVDCVQCHGALGAFKVSPHGPGFDAQAAWARSPRACLGCHFVNPLVGG